MREKGFSSEDYIATFIGIFIALSVVILNITILPSEILNGGSNTAKYISMSLVGYGISLGLAVPLVLKLSYKLFRYYFRNDSEIKN